MDNVAVLEKRLEWLKWAKTLDDPQNLADCDQWALQALSVLEKAESIFVVSHFCDLIEYSRRTVPDDLVFESSWCFVKCGWIYLEKPFEVPSLSSLEAGSDGHPVRTNIPEDYHFVMRAMGWEVFPDGTICVSCFSDTNKNYNSEDCFDVWKEFYVKPGDVLIKSIREFESDGEYVETRESEILHEIRWFYTAMHLMSERLAYHETVESQRHQRRRWMHDRVPLEPKLRVVTLRRYHEARAAGKTESNIEWAFQWPVMGHWRKQWYPSENTHKTKWIEDYVKGPVDKPMKPADAVLFKASR